MYSYFRNFIITGLVIWVLLFAFFMRDLHFLALIFIAFTLGLRHGFDADHIIAIDNVTRSLASRGKQAISTGLFFALGHSSVVFLMTLLILFGVVLVQEQHSMILSSGALIGACISILFLWLTGMMNLQVMVKLIRDKRRAHQHKPTGIISKCAYPLLRLVDKPSKMYAVGFLFGLGFDTATEIALLGIAATSVINGVAIGSILALPIAFALGMSLVDSIDAAIMTKAVHWACRDHEHYRLYMILITAVAFVASMLVAGVEAFSLIDANGGEIISALVNLFDQYSELIGMGLMLIFIVMASGIYLLRSKPVSVRQER
ncbi:MAG: HoxN/HupN/NixA family nickel/cobalt transporter [Francisellaceae bacterium]